jgi:hypothetical protein
MSNTKMKEEDISVGVTAFIDILGFGNKVLNADSIEDIQEIHKGLKVIQEAFDFEPKDDLSRDYQKLSKTTVLAFSDCVIVNIPLQSEVTKYEGTFDPIMSQITSFAIGQGICCLNSLFIRGGLDLGWWYQDGSTLISQSMVNAYKTEGYASVPVIALTSDIYKYFSEHKHRNYYSTDYDPISNVFRQYKENEKDFFYIDYISICLSEVGWLYSNEQRENYLSASPEEKDEIMNQGYKYNVDEWLKTHARNIETAHKATNEQCVKNKYEWLSRYHNEIAGKFTSNPECQCTVQ